MRNELKKEAYKVIFIAIIAVLPLAFGLAGILYSSIVHRDYQTISFWFWILTFVVAFVLVQFKQDELLQKDEDESTRKMVEDFANKCKTDITNYQQLEETLTKMRYWKSEMEEHANWRVAKYLDSEIEKLKSQYYHEVILNRKKAA